MVSRLDASFYGPFGGDQITNSMAMGMGMGQHQEPVSLEGVAQDLELLDDRVFGLGTLLNGGSSSIGGSGSGGLNDEDDFFSFIKDDIGVKSGGGGNQSMQEETKIQELRDEGATSKDMDDFEQYFQNPDADIISD